MRFVSDEMAHQLSKEEVADLSLYSGEGELVEIQPYKDSSRGVRDNIELYKSFHNYSSVAGINTSPINSFEIWFDSKSVRFMMYIGDKDELRREVNQIISNFPGSKVTKAGGKTGIPDVEEGDYVCGARLHLKKHFFMPIRNPDGVEEFKDPYVNILGDLVDNSDVREIIQVVFRPAGEDWTSTLTSDASSFAQSLDFSGDSFLTEDGKEPGEASKAKRNIRSQTGQPGFHVGARIITISKDRKKAIEQVKNLGKSFEDYYREWTGQTLVPSYQKGDGIMSLFREVVSRTDRELSMPGVMSVLEDRETMIMTDKELAALAHIPSGELETSAIRWETLDSTNRLPTRAPSFSDYRTEP